MLLDENQLKMEIGKIIPCPWNITKHKKVFFMLSES